MSDLQFDCPYCRQTLEAPTDMQGDFVDCPSCLQTIEIPLTPAPRKPPQPSSLVSRQDPKRATTATQPLHHPSVASPMISPRTRPGQTRTRILSILAIAAVILFIGRVTAPLIVNHRDYSYTISDGKATITRYNGRGGDITIPNYVGFFRPVTAIGDTAFSECRSVTGVTIGERVTTIGNSAFNYCRYLTSVTIPDTVTSIGDLAFVGCTSLTSVVIPDSVTSISKGTFYKCTALRNVIIGNSVTTIGEGAFFKCAALRNVTIGDNVTSIGIVAFGACTSLTSITIPDSVTSIGGGAFFDCRALRSVYFYGRPPTLTPQGPPFHNSPATLYYLPAHASSWPSSYGGRPTAIWNPAR